MKIFSFIILFVFLSLTLSFLFSINISFSQIEIFEIDNTKTITFPYAASNHDAIHPLTYVFEEQALTENIPNYWILSIDNNLLYSNTADSKTIIKIEEPPPSEKFIELIMFGNQSKGFIVSVNTNDTGYMRLYENNQNGWSTDGPVTVLHAKYQGLSVTNGKRIVIDKLGLNGFNVGSVSIYGKDESSKPSLVHGGNLKVEFMWKSFQLPANQ